MNSTSKKIVFSAVCFLALATCSLNSFAGKKAKVNVVTSNNPIALVTQPENVQMLKSLKDVDGTSRILEMNYTADYKLDAAIASQMKDIKDLFSFVGKNLFDKQMPPAAARDFSAGCSAFAVPELNTGDFLMGRNYDFCHVNPKTHKEDSITAIIVKTAPKGAKKSVAVVDSYWLGLKKGFYTDGKSDLSLLMAAPYAMMDGMNEDGLAISLLHLDGNTCVQNDPDKTSIFLTVAMRLILDKCSDVPSAIDTLRHYNMSMATPAKGNMHFFMADAKGHYSIVEYSYENGVDVKTAQPTIMKPLMDADPYRYTTNFYCDPALRDNSFLGGGSKHGKYRYEILRNKLILNEYKLTYEEAKHLLGIVATNSNPKDNTSHTQWSEIFNLSKRTLDIAVLKDYAHHIVYEVK